YRAATCQHLTRPCTGCQKLCFAPFLPPVMAGVIPLKIEYSGKYRVTTESKFCECNQGELESLPAPFFRLVCHCKTCQEFFGESSNDECTFLLKDCKNVDLKNIELKGYQEGYSPI